MSTTYVIKHPKLGGLDMNTGAAVMALDAALRVAVPVMDGWSYSFPDDTLVVTAPAGAAQALSPWGEAVTVDG